MASKFSALRTFWVVQSIENMVEVIGRARHYYRPLCGHRTTPRAVELPRSWTGEAYFWGHFVVNYAAVQLLCGTHFHHRNNIKNFGGRFCSLFRSHIIDLLTADLLQIGPGQPKFLEVILLSILRTAYVFRGLISDCRSNSEGPFCVFLNATQF